MGKGAEVKGELLFQKARIHSNILDDEQEQKYSPKLSWEGGGEGKTRNTFENLREVTTIFQIYYN